MKKIVWLSDCLKTDKYTNFSKRSVLFFIVAFKLKPSNLF